jgi:hypothetical protein
VKGGLTRDELEAIVHEIQHVREEHRRTHAEGGVRRRLGERLLALEGDFERLLAEWVPDAETKAAWRAHLYEGAPEPEAPAPQAPLVFRGRSEAGSTAEVRAGVTGAYTVEVDGCPVERIDAGLDFASTVAPHTFALDTLRFRETFSASPPALAALRAFASDPEPRPLWRHAAELAADGLIDRHLELTPRGRRALAAGGATPPRRG